MYRYRITIYRSALVLTVEENYYSCFSAGLNVPDSLPVVAGLYIDKKGLSGGSILMFYTGCTDCSMVHNIVGVSLLAAQTQKQD